jgi:O-methyltransferase
MSLKRTIKQLLQSAFSLFGLRVEKISIPHTKEVIFDDETEANNNIKIIRDYTMASYPCLVTLWQQAKYLELNQIEGDYVECGVWKGGSVALMALNNLYYSSKRRNLYLFDSFTNICEPDREVDGEKAVKQALEWSKKGGVDGSLVPLDGFYDQFGGHGTKSACQEIIENKVGYTKERVHYFEGWFQETFPKYNNQIQKIALLRLDADWYASTKICMDYFYDKVVDGGIVIIDDYGTYEGCKKAIDEFFYNKHKPLLNHISKHSRYIIK